MLLQSHEICERIAKLMDNSMASDVEFGAHMSIAGARAAAYNVKINLTNMKDKKYISETEKELNLLLSNCEKLLEYISKKLKKNVIIF